MKFNIYAIDPNTGKKSVSLTILLTTFIVCLTKLLVSGIVINGWTIPEFTATEFAIAMASVAALYWGRKHDHKRCDSIDEIKE